MNIFLIAVGGALGALLRYLSLQLIVRTVNFASAFPVGTFFVNVVGSLAAGIVYYFAIKNFDVFDLRLKNFLLVGFLGGFTTFSAFSLDIFRLVLVGHNLQAFVYALSSVVFAILALFFGFYLAKMIFG